LLAPIIGVPQDTAALIASFIMTDVLGRFPALRLCFAQGGGTFGAALGRMEHSWHSFPQMRATVITSPRDYVRRFAFDSVVFSVDYLRYLLTAFGTDGMMAGTDGPTPIGQTGLADFIMSASDGNEAVAEKILWRNAVRFFALGDMMVERT
jgi:aminocarboxymuconate-semialdehyde decarboxylase